MVPLSEYICVKTSSLSFYNYVTKRDAWHNLQTDKPDLSHILDSITDVFKLQHFLILSCYPSQRNPPIPKQCISWTFENLFSTRGIQSSDHCLGITTSSYILTTTCITNYEVKYPKIILILLKCNIEIKIISVSSLIKGYKVVFIRLS